VLLCYPFVLAAAETDENADREQVDFVGEAKSDSAAWNKFQGSDFNLFYCAAKEPRTGAAAVFLANQQYVLTDDASAATVDGVLGLHVVKWVRRVLGDGAIQQEAVLETAPQNFARVLAEAQNEKDLTTLLAELDSLPVFNQAPDKTKPRRPAIACHSLRNGDGETSSGAKR